jgi:hypothetical protein
MRRAKLALVLIFALAAGQAATSTSHPTPAVDAGARTPKLTRPRVPGHRRPAGTSGCATEPFARGTSLPRSRDVGGGVDQGVRR